MRRPTTLVIVLLFATGMTHLGARSTTLLSFEIEDPPAGGDGVFSDAAAFGDDLGTGTNLYQDYRLDSAEPTGEGAQVPDSGLAARRRAPAS